ncbi:hypothetical protein BK784_28835 [Bacillus thuringiensis serovar medellin]|uniref:Uncharacterized protein n=2 Tax=Bacillus thuringiensis TaxID=1428 RepID=A0A9X6RB27_BACTV|nr:hypothetical protein BK784_28835 [Bacillus thuringiensis serovar medellin]
MVHKNEYREGDHLAFYIYSPADETFNGMHCNQYIEKHFERRMWGDDDKTGTFTNIFDTTEKDHKIYYFIECDSPSDITALAGNIIQEHPGNYTDQRNRFISLLIERNIITRQL